MVSTTKYMCCVSKIKLIFFKKIKSFKLLFSRYVKSKRTLYLPLLRTAHILVRMLEHLRNSKVSRVGQLLKFFAQKRCLWNQLSTLHVGPLAVWIDLRFVETVPTRRYKSRVSLISAKSDFCVSTNAIKKPLSTWTIRHLGESTFRKRQTRIVQNEKKCSPDYSKIGTFRRSEYLELRTTRR